MLAKQKITLNFTRPGRFQALFIHLYLLKPCGGIRLAGNIIMSLITKLLESIFPFLFSALKRAWDSLTEEQQDAITNSGIVGQYLKNNLTALSADLITAITKATGLPASTIESMLISLAQKMGMTTTSADNAAANAVTYIQNKLKTAASDEQWNGFLQTLLNAGATILTGGALNWAHLALGIGEWAYRQYVEPLNIPVLNIVVNDVDKVLGGSGIAGISQASQKAQDTLNAGIANIGSVSSEATLDDTVKTENSGVDSES